MRKLMIAAAAVLLTTAPMAWGQAPSERTAPPVSTTVNLTLEQRHVIKEIVKDLHVPKATNNVPVSVGAARVCARDIVIADANGVVVVPRDRAREVATAARQIEAAEAGIREQISRGRTLREAREALGYHTLQRKAP